MTDIKITEATVADSDLIWAMLEPVFRAGDTYAIDPDISRDDALAYWFTHHAYLARIDSVPVGTYYIQHNRPGGGAHYCNCGFITAPNQTGRGVARAMLNDALDRAPKLGFEGMVFNFVVANNERAVATWEKAGFDIVGRLPGSFDHPTDGRVDSLVMFKKL